MNNLNIKDTNVTKGAGKRLYAVWKTMGNKEVFNKRPVVVDYVMSEEKKKAFYDSFDIYAKRAKANK